MRSVLFGNVLGQLVSKAIMAQGQRWMLFTQKKHFAHISQAPHLLISSGTRSGHVQKIISSTDFKIAEVQYSQVLNPG